MMRWRARLAQGIGLLKTRLQLLAVELEEGLLSVVLALICVFAAVLLMTVAGGLAIVALCLVFWATHPVLVLCGVALCLASLAAGLGWYALQCLRRLRGLFAATLAELTSDQAQLQPTDEDPS